MKRKIFLVVLTSLTLADIVVAQDTLWIDATTPGALEKTINSDTLSGGERAHPLRAYGLHKDGVYIQNAGIVFKGGAQLTIIGEKGGAYPVVQMRPVNGVDPGDLTLGIANKVEGSLHLDHIYWLGKATDGTQYNQLFSMTTVNYLAQKCIVNDCVTEFIGFDTFNGDGWNHGSVWKFTNCYFRALFNGALWWGARVMYCKKPIDTLLVENCTVSNGGLTFCQQESVTRFAYFNHNTFINNHKYWLLNSYYQNLFICNNLFTNQNWVGEDTNVVSGGSGPYRGLTGAITVDSITIRQQLFADMIKPDSTVDESKVGLSRLRIFVSDNIYWTDTLLNSYYKNYNHHWNAIAPYPLSYLNWASLGTGPWPIENIPGIWANDRTLALFSLYSRNMVKVHNTFMKVGTKTPSIKDAGIVELMGQWNQNQWGDPAWPGQPTNALLMSAYVPGDKDANTLPGFTNGVKDENAQTNRVTKVSDFIENYAQTGLPMISTIDGLPIGALHWDDATVPASSYTSILMHYAFEIVGGVATLPGVAGEYKLSQNYPNPFNPTTTIRYGLPHRSHVVLAVFNTLGQEVAVLQTGDQEAGYHEAKFDGTNCASGVYFYRIQAGSFVQTKRLLLLR
jgi:hypothetical protein